MPTGSVLALQCVLLLSLRTSQVCDPKERWVSSPFGHRGGNLELFVCINSWYRCSSVGSRRSFDEW